MVDWSIFRNPKKKEEQGLELIKNEKLEEYGIHVEAGKQLEARIKVIDELSEVIHRPLDGKTPLENMMKLRVKIEEFDTLLRKQSMAWIRAGTEEKFRRAVHGYEKLLRLILRDWLAITTEMEGRDTIDQLKMERAFEIWPCSYYFEKALFLGDMSFSDLDVTPTRDRTIVLQSQMPFGMVPQNKPSLKEDQVGAEMWQEYMRQNEQRLARLERERENAKS